MAGRVSGILCLFGLFKNVNPEVVMLNNCMIKNYELKRCGRNDRALM
jgi:hypothetical protein